MKRKIRLSALLAVAVLMLALMIGGLYGYFNDTEPGNGNIFTAGTLDLQTWVEGTSPTGAAFVVTPSDNVNGICGHVAFSNVAPGDNGTITWTLTNAGTVDGDLTFDNVSVVFSENGTNEPEGKVAGNNNGSNGDLDQYMYCRLSQDGGDLTGLIQFSGLQAALASQAGALDAGTATTYELYWEIAPTVGNVIQSDTATIDITFNLVQV
jgi:predicted ribosomally synthesized peptide with SipW-like signal peptide